jgi:thiol-disulfide isomerase/thioredoxin
MRSIYFSIILILFSLATSGQVKKGYEITVSINGIPDSTVYLAFHLGDKQYLKDTLKLDKNGYGVFTGAESLPQGIYMIVIPGRKYFEILISSDQYFSLSCSYNDYFNTLKITGSDENNAFINYQKHWINLQDQAGIINKRIQNNKQNSDSLKILTETGNAQEQKMKVYLKSVIDQNNGNLLGVLVKALLPIEAPTIIIPPDSPNPDSVKWIKTYLFNKDHFFDNIDLNDERLLRTPILQAKLDAFFKIPFIQHPDSINKEIDRIFEKCRNNNKIFQFIAVYLFNHFRESEIMGHDAVIVKLADDIYLSGKADWVTKEFKDDLRKQVDLIRPNLIGKKAQNLIMDSYNGKFVSLYDVNKEFTILYFWEPNCGHCQEATPKLKAYYDKVKDNGIEVFTICTQTDKAKWEKYIQDNKLTWINGWDPQRISRFDYYYNIQSTPIVYLLDKNKIIIAKKLSVENIESFIENYRKYNK